MTWSRGVWFFPGKPFLLHKWSPHFWPKRENFTSVPIWLKIHDLPLACWNTKGISKIISKIGIALIVDALTLEKSRLTYVRVCVKVTNTTTYLEHIPISIKDEIMNLRIQNEWKPMPCDTCGSLVHPPALCPSKATSLVAIEIPKRGRTTSQARRKHIPSASPTPLF
ncbi:hypothetical protein M5K25_012711 [Dendrobium thyrsiflorum]|uniref:DUF4283 domain-containing protein n=1 Tax=Dendrobium thyrsiflorum TaxID=117978 RepID=A0ABD0UXW2_DENTH